MQIYKSELQEYINKRFKSEHLAGKMLDFFFHDDQDTIRLQDYFKRAKTMLQWSRVDQLGFCFHLFDRNGDGFICIEDLFRLLQELTDFDFVITEDINKLVAVLR